MSDLLVFSVDVESETGAPIAKTYGVGPLPTLLFLEPDGAVRDQITGYLPPEPFLAEVQRIKRDEDTLSGYRREVEADPDDLDARYAFAKKLEAVGDIAGAEEQRAQIRERDPEGTSLASRRLAFEAAFTALQSDPDLDPAPLYALAAEETDKALLFDLWYVLWQVENNLAQGAEDDAKKAEHRTKWVAAGRQLWQHAAEDDIPSLGNNLAWSFWELRTELSADDRAFALEVATKTSKAAPEDASVLDTLACALHMNGRKEEALATLDRAIALDPENEEWRARRTVLEQDA